MKYMKKIGISTLLAILVLQPMTLNVEAANKVITFGESTSRNQTQSVTLSNLKSINSVTSSTGSVAVQSINGDQVVLSLSGGAVSRTVQTGGSPGDSMYVTAQTSSYYNSGGYTGYLSSYYYGTTSGPSQSKTATASRSRTMEYCAGYPTTNTWQGSIPSSVSYNSDGYSGTLSKSGSVMTSEVWGSACQSSPYYGEYMYKTETQNYSGTVTKPGDSVNEYRYQGTVTKPDTRTYTYYYQYTVTIDYEDNTAPTVPGLLTSPIKYIKGGSAVNVSWGASTDADGNALSYQLQFFDGASWQTLVSSTSNNSFTHSVPNLNVDTAKYRVRAYDSIEYSSYRTSPNLSVDSTNPTISFDLNTREWETEEVKVNVSYADAGTSGLKEVRYAWSKVTTKPTSGWSGWTYATSQSPTQEDSGVWYLHAEARDYAGNTTHQYKGPYKVRPITNAGIAIQVSPTPTGKWENNFIGVYVTDSGDSQLFDSIVKKYEISGNVELPASYTKTMPTDQKILLNRVGANYLHIQYTLYDGSNVTSTTGPYFIDTAAVGTFEASLLDSKGVKPTGWVNENLELKIGNPSTASVSGYVKQYRIDTYHETWQTYLPGTQIDLEGEQRIFVRVINQAGTSSEVQTLTAKIDSSPPNAEYLQLVAAEDGTFDVEATITDVLSGIKEVKVANTSKVLTSVNSRYVIQNLPSIPSGLIMVDHAGNTSGIVTFAKDPTITFASPYTMSTKVYREDVKVTISNGDNLSFKAGNKRYNCESEACQYVISQNGLMVVENSVGIKKTFHEFRISNIDKTRLNLLLEGQRNQSNPTQLDFNWNYELSDGQLICEVFGETETHAVSNTGKTVIGVNGTYDCRLEADYGGERLISNRVLIYPDAQSPLAIGAGIEKQTVETNIYIDESRIGTSYLINTKSNNFKGNQIPIPMNKITTN